MSVKIAVRLPDEMHAKLMQIAEADGCTLSDAIVGAITDGLHVEPYVKVAALPAAGQGIAIPTITPAIRKAHQVASTVLNVTTAAQLPPATAYQRPKHAENCHCYACRPPKGDK